MSSWCHSSWSMFKYKTKNAAASSCITWVCDFHLVGNHLEVGRRWNEVHLHGALQVPSESWAEALTAHSHSAVYVSSSEERIPTLLWNNFKVTLRGLLCTRRSSPGDYSTEQWDNLPARLAFFFFSILHNLTDAMENLRSQCARGADEFSWDHWDHSEQRTPLPQLQRRHKQDQTERPSPLRLPLSSRPGRPCLTR